MKDFVEFLKQERGVSVKAMQIFFDGELTAARKVDETLVELTEAIAEFAVKGGKKARSVLTRLAFDLAGGGAGSGEIVAASLFPELTHLYLLVHDDIADRDLVRYGGDTLQVKFEKEFKRKFGWENPHFGISGAMVTGDLISAMAHKALVSSGFEAERIVKAEQIMARVMGEVVTGWYLHQVQNHISVDEVSEERYLHGMKLVSASYSFEAPLLIGLALAGAPEKYERCLTEYAFHAGMAFQIQDDILGVFGDSDETGKPVGNDIREGKKTLLVLRAYTEGNSQQQSVIRAALGKDQSEESLGKVQQVIRETGSLEYSLELAHDHVEKAKQALKPLADAGGEGESLQRLIDLAEYTVSRKL